MAEENPSGTDPEPADGEDSVRPGESTTESTEDPLPEQLVETAERLARLASRAVDEAEASAYRQELERRLEAFEYTHRVREEDTGGVLVLHPAEWVTDNTVAVDEIDDLDRAIERRLSGVGEATAFEEVDAHNRGLVEEVEERAGAVHAANAAAFADFMGNHYVRRVETATADEIDEFSEDYFRRNAFPTDEQRAVLEESLRMVFDIAGEEYPGDPGDEYPADRRQSE